MLNSGHQGLHGGILRHLRHGNIPNNLPHLMSQQLVLNTNERSSPIADHTLGQRPLHIGTRSSQRSLIRRAPGEQPSVGCVTRASRPKHLHDKFPKKYGNKLFSWQDPTNFVPTTKNNL